MRALHKAVQKAYCSTPHSGVCRSTGHDFLGWSCGLSLTVITSVPLSQDVHVWSAL